MQMSPVGSVGGGGTSAASVAATGGSAVRSLPDWFSDANSLKGQGGVGTDSAVPADITVTNAALTAAAALGPVFVPQGVYQTSLTEGSVPSRLLGYGQVRDSATRKRAPYRSNITARPNALGSHGTFLTSFNGNIGGVQFPIEHIIRGAATLSQPATGYAFTPEASAFLQRFYNESGHNEQLGSNVGRTAAVFADTHLHQAGQGDMMERFTHGIITSARADATHWLAGPAVTIQASDFSFGVDKAYQNPYEHNSRDVTFYGSAISWVHNFHRNQDETSPGASIAFTYWAGTHYQSLGTKAVNNGFLLSGLWRRGINFANASFPATGQIEAAIVLKGNQRTYWNATAGADVFVDPTLGVAYTAYSTSLNALVSANNTATTQLYNNLFLCTHAIRSEVEFRVSTNKVVGARIAGWTAATGTATRGTFATGTVTLPQLAERVKALIDDLHATAGHGLIGA